MVDRIKTLLETRQLTPTQFADLIGTARPIVSHVLSGRNKPSLEVVQRILAALPELSMAWLLNGTGDMYTSTADAPTTTARPPDPSEPPVASAPIVAAPAPVVPPPAPVVPPPAPVVPPMASFTAKKSTYLPARTSSTPAIRRFTPQQPEAAHTVAGASVPTAPATVPAPTPVQPLVQEPVGAPVPAARAETAPEDVSASIATALLAGAEKPIRRIVIFYRDGSFGDYQPE